MDSLHRLLTEQLKQLRIDPQAASPELKQLILEVDSTYRNYETQYERLQQSFEQNTRQLRQSHSELEVIFSTFPDMFFRLDTQNRLLEFKVGEQQISYPPIQRMLGHTINRMPLPEVRDAFIPAVATVRRTGKPEMVQFKMERQPKPEYFEARLFPLPNNQIVCVIRNITETKTAELELIKSEQQYRTVLESSPDPIIVYDMEGNTQYLNPAFTRVFGWSLPELKSGPVDFVPEHAKAETREKIRQLKEGRAIQGFETQRYNREGETLAVIINASLLLENEHKAIGSVVTIVDITRLKKLEAELRYTKDQAESANQAKSEFLANMSHELRTPMHAILGFAKIVIEKIDRLEKAKLLEYIEEVFSAGQRLMLLLNDLLDLAKLEVGRVDYDMKSQSLATIVSLVIHEFSSVSSEKEIEIEFEKPGFDDRACFDQNKIIQVVRNLLSNAIKFSYANGKIIIRITKQSGILMLSIKDFGIGIPPDELEIVFDKFVQSSKSKSEAGGTGLGLAICSEIVAAHEGRIWAKNNAEGGTTFFVTLSSL
jgi:PAS domain S-box-containing protein